MPQSACNQHAITPQKEVERAAADADQNVIGHKRRGSTWSIVEGAQQARPHEDLRQEKRRRGHWEAARHARAGTAGAVTAECALSDLNVMEL